MVHVLKFASVAADAKGSLDAAERALAPAPPPPVGCQKPSSSSFSVNVGVSIATDELDVCRISAYGWSIDALMIIPLLLYMSFFTRTIIWGLRHSHKKSYNEYKLVRLSTP